jgi:hypothetical protein
MKYTFLVLLISGFYGLLAIEKPITGTVWDAQTNEPLPFTNVVIEGKYTGTVSNVDGHFVLDVEGIDPDQVIVFSYVGYETFKITAIELMNQEDVYLKPATLNLNAVSVYSKQLTAEDIIDKVKENYEVNHPKSNLKQRIFYHKYEKVQWPTENQIVLKESDFVGLDRSTFEDLFAMMPEQFIEYHDAMVDLYSYDNEMKLEPIEAISLEEGSMEKLQKEVENKLESFIEDIENSQSDPDVYYKFRTGILAGKLDFDDEVEPDSIQIEQKKDSLNYLIHTDHLQSSINRMIENWADIKSDNWGFINKTGKYNYVLGEVTILNDELVYAISFTPQRSGLFEGHMYISTATFGILQVDYAYAAGKKSENIHLLGFGHSMNDKKAHVIFEKTETGYFVKYINAEQQESASIDRAFSMMKKEKRFLFDKELNEIKMSVDLNFDMHLNLEILVLDREAIDSDQFEKVSQPKITKFRKEFAYSPEVWNNRTVIAPSADLQKFKRK